MKFTKMHGIGNDFIVVNTLQENLPEERLPEISRRLNDRKFGIGGDGLILVAPSRIADFKMRMFNPDGSESEMCGNGIRCFARYVYDRQLTGSTQIKIETLAGVKIVRLLLQGGRVNAVRVDMGAPRLLRSEIPMRGEDNTQVIREPLKIEGQKFEITAVSMGNPHVIIFEDNLENFPVAKWGPLIENHRSFPERTNVHFVKVCSPGEVVIRTWERGAGETLACGTGACATVVACVLNNRTGRLVEAHLPGGDLRIEWTGDNRVLMTGPAEEVFEGTISL
ncbi:MAG: diaminopimelate epimerase [Chloroherpetonaceae bacterium]|nr:diaminopimelate epimerase [Chthonomonadaceae bacterium]MDW8208188.1 diaminopimelate epimerase [Chloroherpetonaceae bacterium]